MRYMLLVYTTEGPNGLAPDEAQRIRARHSTVISEATRKGVLAGAEPLAPTSTATTVRVKNGAVLVTDGPFAETKEQTRRILHHRVRQFGRSHRLGGQDPYGLSGHARMHRDPADALPERHRRNQNDRGKRGFFGWLISGQPRNPSFVSSQGGSSRP